MYYQERCIITCIHYSGISHIVHGYINITFKDVIAITMLHLFTCLFHNNTRVIHGKAAVNPDGVLQFVYRWACPVDTCPDDTFHTGIVQH